MDTPDPRRLAGALKFLSELVPSAAELAAWLPGDELSARRRLREPAAGADRVDTVEEFKVKAL